MSNGQLLPLSSYNLEVLPGMPTLAVDEDFPVSIRLTMAAIDPSKADGEEPSTLRILKKPSDFPEDGLLYDSDEDEDEDEEEEEEEKKEEPKKQKKDSKKSKKEEESEEYDDEEMDEDDDDEDDEGFEIQEYALCTLGPKVAYQQPLDIVINSSEEVLFEVTGSYPIHLSGNYVEHPYDADSDDYDSDLGDSDEDDQLDDEGEYDLSPDEDEVIEGSDRIQELREEEEEEEKPKSKKEKKKEAKKRSAEAAVEEEKPKKQKKGEDKKVSFTKDLESGPSGSKKAKKLEGGVTVEDRSVGEGPTVKKGDKIGVRYIGKLANGKVFDSNTKGKPFYFTVGKGEVIKGWEVGVAGMATKGERRIVIPAPMAYGKQALPGIPANSELTFDVKLVNIK
ncbi:hypothetical protein TRICI_000098 [Trichomonascus ciferrii]|uniref:FK506-binding protein n=1 Tax=Trichomonascus ciferrii TaxID=44093 RepID=A0A642VEI1_9ASCO|nr:hypothetical protein TRICI_000098 [Trichomonascus ciferrii]